MTDSDGKAWRCRWKFIAVLALVIMGLLFLGSWPIIPTETEWESQHQESEFRIAITSLSWANLNDSYGDRLLFDYYVRDLRYAGGKPLDAGDGQERCLFWDSEGRMTECPYALHPELGFHQRRAGLAGRLGILHNTKITTWQVLVPAGTERFAIRLTLWTGDIHRRETILTTNPVTLPPRTKRSTADDLKKMRPSGDKRQMDRWHDNDW